MRYGVTLGTVLLLGVAASSFAAEPRPLFDGKSLAGWEGDTAKTWRVEDGAIVGGSLDETVPRNEFLATTREFGDFELTLKYKLVGTEGFVNGGVQFRSRRIPDHHEMIGYQADLGMGHDGALYDESRRKRFLARPSDEVLNRALRKEDWNEYRIRAEGPRVRLWLNGVPTVDYTETDPDIPRAGLIALQIHGGCKAVVRFKDVRIEELSPTTSSGDDSSEGWTDLLAGGLAKHWTTAGNWSMNDDGVVTLVPRPGETGWQRYDAYLWSKETYDDFEIDFEYRVEEKGNSGFYFNVGDKSDPVAKGIEVQIYDAPAEADAKLTDHDSGGVIPGVPPTAAAAKPAGEWNRFRITVRGDTLTVRLNDRTVNEVELKKHPRLKERPDRGFIGFQDHGLPLALRNIRVRRL
ncbi:MAG TPA: DUF1080 domain-containing protein [Planctomycetaceae bacterium]